MTVNSATFPAIGVDSDSVLTESSAAALRSSGMTFAIRYLSLTAPQSPGDLSPAEVVTLLQAGLAVMAVQHVRDANWMPSDALGTQDGNAAVANALECKLPPGMTLWCDSEGQSGGANETIAHVNAWAAAVTAGGFDPGLYVGSGTPLDGQQLFSLSLNRYWKSFSQVNEPTCGWCLIQLFPSTNVGGVDVDVDVIQRDYFNRLPAWVTQ